MSRKKLSGLTLGAALVCSVSSSQASDVLGSYQGFSWRITASAFTRTIGSTHMSPGSMTTEADVPAVPTTIQGPRAKVGSADAIAGRLYDDGYVSDNIFRVTRPGETPPPPMAAPPRTYDWAVKDPSQIQGHTVLMSAADGTRSVNIATHPSETTVTGSSETGTDNEWGQSLQVEFGYSGNTSTVWSVLGAFTTLHGSRGSSQTSFSETRSWMDMNQEITDTFGLIGNSVVNIPLSRTTSETEGYHHSTRTENSVQQQLDFDLRTISIGVSLSQYWHGLQFSAATGPTVSFLSADLERSETVTVSHDGGPQQVERQWHEAQSETKTLLGAFAQGSVEYRITRVMHLGVLTRYDLSQNYKTTLGPSSYDTRMSGFSVGASVGWEL